MSAMLKIALPVLAVAGSSYAASCSATATLTVQNSGDVPTSCSTYSGSIAIQTGAAGPIAFDGIQKLDGDLTVTNNSAIKAITGSDLQEITGALSLQDVSSLNQLSFPKLASVDKFTVNGAAVLQQLDTKITKVSTIDIENTQLTSLNGISVTQADQITIANNFYISSISLPLANISKALTISNNNPEVNVSLPNLVAASNLTFINASSVSVPLLANTTGSLGLYGNVFTDFSAVNLTKVGGALAVVSNTQLTNISFPALTTVTADLQVSNNTKLSALNETFPKLAKIGGALQFNGNFSSVSLPSLNQVVGTFTIKSTGDIQSQCDSNFKPLKSKGAIQGGYTCQGTVADPNNPTSTATGTGSSAKKTGAAVAVNVENSALMAGLFAAFFL